MNLILSAIILIISILVFSFLPWYFDAAAVLAAFLYYSYRAYRLGFDKENLIWAAVAGGLFLGMLYFNLFQK